MVLVARPWAWGPRRSLNLEVPDLTDDLGLTENSWPPSCDVELSLVVA